MPLRVWVPCSYAHLISRPMNLSQTLRHIEAFRVGSILFPFTSYNDTLEHEEIKISQHIWQDEQQ